MHMLIHSFTLIRYIVANYKAWISQSPYATSHTRYRVDETGVQEMRCIVRQGVYVSMSCMYRWRDSVIWEWERQCTATQRGHHWDVGAHRLPEHTPHVHSHRGGGQCSQLWTQCAGCQSSAGGGGILTAGEKEKQWTELEVILFTAYLSVSKVNCTLI